MKIELTGEEVSRLVLRHIVESQKIVDSGDFKLEWRLAVATGQPAKLIGCDITIQETKTP